jgi:hypothetical protein
MRFSPLITTPWILQSRSDPYFNHEHIPKRGFMTIACHSGDRARKASVERTVETGESMCNLGRHSPPSLGRPPTGSLQRRSPLGMLPRDPRPFPSSSCFCLWPLKPRKDSVMADRRHNPNRWISAGKTSAQMLRCEGRKGRVLPEITRKARLARRESKSGRWTIGA